MYQSFDRENEKRKTIEFANKLDFGNFDLAKTPIVAISISGGVDSMVIAHNLVETARLQAQHQRTAKREDSQTADNVCKKPPKFILLHLVYGNRPECEQEVDFLRQYADRLRLPLYVHRITEIKRKRNSKFRELYEEVTRKIRFAFYRYFDCPVILGHNLEDTEENIVTNLAKGRTTGGLKGMKPR